MIVVSIDDRHAQPRTQILKKHMTPEIFVTLALACGASLSTAASAQTLPFYPRPAEVVSSESPNSPGDSRLRISVTVSQDVGVQQVLVGNITACSESACYRPVTSTKTASLYTTKDGNAETVVEFAIPRAKILSVHFESLPGAKTVVGSVNIANPMVFDEEYFGESVLVVLGKSGGDESGRYAPQFAVAGPFHPAARSVYYNPAIATVARLGMSTTLSIPANATENPVIFNVAVHDTLDKFPLVDIYPAIFLSPPATLSSQEIRRGSALAASSATTGGYVPPEVSSKSLPKTGLIRLDSDAAAYIEKTNLATAESNAVVAAAAATDACSLFLSSKQQAISSALSTTGTVFIRGCESTPPYVHIAVSNTLDSREQGSLSYSIANRVRALLNLQTLPTFASGTQVAINGFTWNGDSGTTSGTGYALGFVQNNEVSLANNLVGGGLQSSGTYDSNKLVLNQESLGVAKWKEGSIPPLWVYNPALPPAFYVGSSTSIVKAGACASDANVNRWSAIGSTPGGRLIFISSTSAGTTSATELCSIFTGLGSNYAIRLDGSTATGMTIDGTLVNPITGSSALVYGPSRHIAYAVQMKYRSVQAGPTPVMYAGPNVPPPRNPCKVDPAPRRCQ